MREELLSSAGVRGIAVRRMAVFFTGALRSAAPIGLFSRRRSLGLARLCGVKTRRLAFYSYVGEGGRCLKLHRPGSGL